MAGQKYLERMIGNPLNVSEGRARTMMENKIRLIQGRLQNGMGVDLPGVAGTAWHALNAMVEFADDMNARGQALDPSRRTNSILFGRGAEFKQEALDDGDDCPGSCRNPIPALPFVQKQFSRGVRADPPPTSCQLDVPTVATAPFPGTSIRSKGNTASALNGSGRP